MPIESKVLLFVAFINLLLAYTIGIRNIKSPLHRMFALLIAFNVLWALGDAIMLGSRDMRLVDIGKTIFFVAPVFTAWTLLLFTFDLTNTKLKHVVNVGLACVTILITAWITIYDPLVTNFHISASRLNSFEVDIISYGVYSSFFAVFFGMSYILLFLGFVKNHGKTRAQSLNIFWAAIFSSGAASFTNLVLPMYGNSGFVWLGPIFTLSYIGIVGYSIAHNRLFDMRKVVVRSIAYSVTVLILASITQIFIYVMFGDEFGLSGMESILVASIFFIAGLSFPSILGVFNRFTSRIFYRDAYDLDKEIDKISSISVTEYEIDQMAQDSLRVVNNAIKPGFSKLVLVDSAGEYYNDYSMHSGNKVPSIQAVDNFEDHKQQIIDMDEIDPSDEYSKSKTYKYLSGHSISMSVQLRAKNEVVGYMLFGAKLSGNIYSQQDKDFLGIAANEMAVAIQNARRFDEIKRFNETLRLEVDRATKELRESNEKLQELDQAKDEFVSMASHQLRTPLTSVKGYISMVLEGDAGKVDKKQRDLLTAAFTSSQRMVYLISDLLNVSRLQTGKFVIEPVVSYLPDIVESEIGQLQETAKAKNQKVNYRKPKKFPEVYIDETKTRQVIMNFIDNAIYYTPPGGVINIVLEATDNKIEYRVTDNGIGVPRHEQKNLFTKFYRATNAKKARPDGTGLGLFMAKKVIVDQGGAVIFESKEDHGSTFGFTFPLTRIRPPKDKQTEAATKKSRPKAKKTSRK